MTLKKLVHYIYGSGEHGCLYDNGPFASDTLQGAVDSLAETFELGRTRKAALKRDHYLELNPRRDGASYCEITECTCKRPWGHNEDDDPENWPDYPQPIHCDQCEMLSINGVACHESGCPNQGARWDIEQQTWIKQRECFECGCTVDADDPCCSAQEEEEEEDEQ